jgi:hypothetical protein
MNLKDLFKGFIPTQFFEAAASKHKVFILDVMNTLTCGLLGDIYSVCLNNALKNKENSNSLARQARLDALKPS